jgi:hypothetical protein
MVLREVRMERDAEHAPFAHRLHVGQGECRLFEQLSVLYDAHASDALSATDGGPTDAPSVQGEPIWTATESFEQGTGCAGWSPSPSNTQLSVASTGGHDGVRYCRACATQSSTTRGYREIGLLDAGGTFVFEIWARSDGADGGTWLAQIGVVRPDGDASVETADGTLSPYWSKVTVSTAIVPGSSILIDVMRPGSTVGECFGFDDVRLAVEP